jgi:DNA-binding transcriptional regulator/RsmH inhibitor MraZ
MPRLKDGEQGGIIEKAIDEIGRLTLGAEQRPDFPDRVAYVLPWIEPCLRLTSAAKLQELEADVRSRFSEPRRLELALRRTIACARRLQLDRNYRLRIPPLYWQLLELSGDERKVWLMRLGEGLYEIWNPQTWMENVWRPDVYTAALGDGTPQAARRTPPADGGAGERAS